MEEINFLQSHEWGQFQDSLGNKVFNIVSEKCFAQYYFVGSRFAKYLYCPRGPLASSQNEYSDLLEKMIEDAKEMKVDFILIEPSTEEIVSLLQKKGFIKQSKSTQPEHTSIVSLLPDAQALHSQLRKTTRQMIRKATESKVEITSYDDLSRWQDFVNLLTETAQRQKFTPHTLSYMKRQFEVFAGKAKLYLAEADGKVLAGAVILSYGKTSTYLHAGGNSLGRELGAAQLLVWTAIGDAKEKGDTEFDLWGIAPDEVENHPWRGITIFKKGFGGETVTYPGSFLLPLRKGRYNFYRLINFLRAAPPLRTAQRVLLSAITKG